MPWAVDLHVDDMLGAWGCFGIGIAWQHLRHRTHANNDIRLEAHNISFDDNSTFAEASRALRASCMYFFCSAAVTK
jgi:hypothetical protein